MDGRKNDIGKLRWDLLPWSEIEQIVSTLTYGSVKYSDDNWKIVVSANPKRYMAAAMRHFVAWIKGERLDPESGEHHLAHCACCILFLLWQDKDK